MTQLTCPLQQPRCGLQEGNPICPKCGLDARVPYVTDGSAWETGAVERVLRGGSVGNGARSSRSAYRVYYSPGVRSGNFGFRLARTLP